MSQQACQCCERAGLPLNVTVEQIEARGEEIAKLGLPPTDVDKPAAPASERTHEGVGD
jgi:hypothetical protein